MVLLKINRHERPNPRLHVRQKEIEQIQSPQAPRRRPTRMPILPYMLCTFLVGWIHIDSLSAHFPHLEEDAGFSKTHSRPDEK